MAGRAAPSTAARPHGHRSTPTTSGMPRPDDTRICAWRSPGYGSTRGTSAVMGSVAMGQAPANGAPETTALGFESPSTTAAPDTLFDFWLPRLSGTQLRILLFLIRRCYGPDGH